ncbi:MAG: hypothetical protein ACKVJU_14545 [Verrucomicrobiales bacterium]
MGQQLFPVRPGSNRFRWGDKSNGKVYTIELVSGYPGDIAKLASAAEKLVGERKKRSLTNCTITTGLVTSTITCDSTVGLAPGDRLLSDSKIDSGTTVQSVESETQFVISKPAISNGAGLTLMVYDTEVKLASIDPNGGFPGKDDELDAHYRHLYDSDQESRPKTKLDLSKVDEWKCLDLTYTDKDTRGTVADDEGRSFTTVGTGRSVLLFSYRPDSDEIADGNFTREKLAVRVVRSSIIPPIDAGDADEEQLVLGQHGLDLSDGGFNISGPIPASTTSSGTGFLIDFWLNSKNLQVDATSTLLTNSVTTDGGKTVTCDDTTGLEAGMDIGGPNISPTTTIVSVNDAASSFELSLPATGTGTALALTASNRSVTLLTSGDDGRLAVTLNVAASTITADYCGVPVTHVLPSPSAAWRHYAIHVFGTSNNGIPFTQINFYADGVRRHKGPANSEFVITPGGDLGELKFGGGPDPLSGLLIDQFRLFGGLAKDSIPLSSTNPWLTQRELNQLRNGRDLTDPAKQLRGNNPLLWFSFETAPTVGGFANEGSLGVDLSTISGTQATVLANGWGPVGLQEVATRLESTLDNAGFGGSGYVLNEVSNYNASIYNRAAEIGAWGNIFPVNDKRLFTEDNRRLEVAYYENPYRQDPLSNPNVAWPYQVATYDDIDYPTVGPNKDKAIYIASRIGSEGVDRNGRLQQIFDLSEYSDLAIYNQPDPTLAGYNPNEEHALVAGSGRAGLKVKNLGADIPNNPPLAAFALQTSINATTPYSSDPWVLVQVNNLATGEAEMAAYQVFATRDGTFPNTNSTADSPIPNFPRPVETLTGGTSGLAYEPAANPDDRFLTIDPDPAKTYNFEYKFDYPAFAGDLLIPPYPLNLVVGNVTMQDDRGGNTQVGGINQRTLWRDVNDRAWVASGDGQFFHQFFYPFRGDFFFPNTENPPRQDATNPGTPVVWLPQDKATFTGDGETLEPVRVNYRSSWRTSYPKLKRGETLTYQGGEYFAETPGANGLPALVAMAAAEVIYDSATPSMDLGTSATSSAPATANIYDMDNYSARIVRPLDRREIDITQVQMGASGFEPSETDKVLVVAERWYFKELPGSLQKRFYYDSLVGKLVFRGLLNSKESGDPDLTAGPDPINTLEPNVLSASDYERIKGLSSAGTWPSKIDALYLLTQNPHQVSAVSASKTDRKFLSGLRSLPADLDRTTGFYRFYTPDGSAATVSAADVLPLNSFGVGSSLVTSPSLLRQSVDGSLYVTIAENNREELSGAPISLHIIEIIPDRYRGAISVHEGADVFSEKITLQHNGEFGGNTDDLYYEWWIRDAAPLGVINKESDPEILDNGFLKETDSDGNTLWQQYIPEERASLTSDLAIHRGLNTIVFEGRPDVTLADKLVLMRYRHKDETGWNLVPFEVADSKVAWEPNSPAPFQWAGAANSPQTGADGGKVYIPQLVMGWVKRVLDRINPYEARYNDFYSSESPATYSSQIQIAGAPSVGAVALNPDKNVIENVGLIELYETVLQRAKDLSIGLGNNNPGINQALLLATTRLSVLYELLAREAYSDAQDPTIRVTGDSGLGSVASFTHAFQNMEADLMHEELALLRGTDFGKSYPVYNRIFWNYAKGLGEAAYNVNYNIYDENADGFINEDDARALYPQGHGDSWGHFVSAIDMHYTLLQHPSFSWRTRSELYSLMQNVLEVDFLDEKTFARLAAGKARAGRDIVRGTYRLNYTQDPDGQWQGYTDAADPARAWGVSEWAHRAGQGAYFDWAVANALLPDEAGDATPVDDPENLDRIDRHAAEDEISEITGGLHEIQLAMDEANGGVNPLGFDTDAIAFDIDPTALLVSSAQKTQFEQIYERALSASRNAVATLDYATKAENKLRALGDDTNAKIAEAFSQDLDYRNRLIEIFGRPYNGQIGFGKPYPEGYQGPDLLLYMYLDRTSINQIVPGNNNLTGTDYTEISAEWARGKIWSSDNQHLQDLYTNTGLNKAAFDSAFNTYLNGSGFVDYDDLPDSQLTLPVRRTASYAFQVDAADQWGKRTSYGKLQQLLERMLQEEMALKKASAEYVGFLGDLDSLVTRLEQELGRAKRRGVIGDESATEFRSIRDTIRDLRAAQAAANITVDLADRTATMISEFTPDSFVAGFSFGGDLLSTAAGSIFGVANAVAAVANIASQAYEADIVRQSINLDENIEALGRQLGRIDQIAEIEGIMEEIENLSGDDEPIRTEIGMLIQQLEITRQAYATAQAEGFRLLKEREGFNTGLAGAVQGNRYNDMIFRLSRNEAMNKYQSAYNHAARYAWMAARAYDYETNLDPGNPAAPGQLLDRIVKERQLGLWSGGQPQVGQGGLAEILSQLNSNFQVLKGQLGLNNPQSEVEKISLRSELFRIGSGASSDARWKDALNARRVDDLTSIPQFVRYCRPFSTPEEGKQPGMVIRFSTHINNGVNVFGKQLASGDHKYSTANFATKVSGFGVWLDNYNAAGLATSPRAYLVPVGADFLRTSTSAEPVTRAWNVVEQRIPTPFTINQNDLRSPGYIPTLNGIDGGFAELRRHGDFRMYHGTPNSNGAVDDSELILNSRLIGRSVWNSEWMLIIPGAGLHADPATGLENLAKKVTDIKIHFKTYSHQGQ